MSNHDDTTGDPAAGNSASPVSTQDPISKPASEPTVTTSSPTPKDAEDDRRFVTITRTSSMRSDTGEIVEELAIVRLSLVIHAHIFCAKDLYPSNLKQRKDKMSKTSSRIWWRCAL